MIDFVGMPFFKLAGAVKIEKQVHSHKGQKSCQDKVMALFIFHLFKDVWILANLVWHVSPDSEASHVADYGPENRNENEVDPKHGTSQVRMVLAVVSQVDEENQTEDDLDS